MRLALWQGEGVPGDLAATLAEAARIAAEAKARGADLLVFPEGYLTGYYRPHLAPGDLAGVEAALADLRGIARQEGIALVMGTHTRDGDAIRNSAVAISATGEELGRYHKRALFGLWEKATFRPGEADLVFPAGDIRVGVAICYDVEFPEIIRSYARRGAQLLVVPTALMAPHDRIARQVVAVRAMESQLFVGYCNRTGREEDLDFVGLSCICGPRGGTVAAAADQPGLLLADLDPEEIRREVADNSYLADVPGLRGLA